MTTPTNKALEAARTADEVVKALREAQDSVPESLVSCSELFSEAADMIERLAKENARLSKLAVDAVRPMVGAAKSAEAERDALKRQLEKAEHALKPFAELAVALGSEHQPPDSYVGGGITHAHLLAASRASSAEKEAGR